MTDNSKQKTTVETTMEDAELKKGVEQRLRQLYQKDDGIEYRDDQTKIVIPKDHDKESVIKVLRRAIEDEQKVINWSKSVGYRYVDGLVALDRVIKDIWGFAEQQSIPQMFGEEKPRMKTVQVGYNESVEVPEGRMGIVTPDGEVTIQTFSPDNGASFGLAAETKKKHVPLLKMLWDRVTNELRTNSIYKEQAIDSDYNFMNVEAVNPDEIVLASDVRTQIEANIMTPIRNTGDVRENGIPIKRGILLEGPYGTGKSLTAGWTALECVRNGWTFVNVKDADSFGDALDFARNYEPSVLFIEDIDQDDFGGQSNEAINDVLNSFDGVDKTAEVMCILTTNHVEDVHEGLMRPGRLDAVIHLGELDVQGTAKMLEVKGEEGLSDKVNVKAFHEACEGYTPAFVDEAIRKTKLYGLSGETKERWTTENLVQAANELRRQYRFMNADPDDGPVTLDERLGEIFEDHRDGEELVQEVADEVEARFR